MNRARLGVMLVLCFTVAIVMLEVSRSDAIPAFARKHRVSCSTCHAPFPRLKPFGEEFAGRGFRMPEGQEPARATYDVGDPLLELARELPLAVRLEGHATWREDEQAESDVEWPWTFKIMSGGPIAKSVSYYFYAIIEKGEVEGLEDAYLQVNSPLDLPFDLLIGQFQVSDPLFKRELRLERLFDYDIYKVQPGLSRVDLTYDRGVAAVFTLPGSIDSTLQVVNGNGKEHARGNSFDRDDYKNLSLRLSRDLGPVRVGAFGYWGREETAERNIRNETTYWGPDLTISTSDSWELNLQYLERTDDDPFFVGVRDRDPEMVTDGGFAELHIFPQGPDGRWGITCLYNRVQSDLDELDVENASLSLSYLIARNVRLLVEAGRDVEHNQTAVGLGLVSAF